MRCVKLKGKQAGGDGLLDGPVVTDLSQTVYNGTRSLVTIA